MPQPVCVFLGPTLPLDEARSYLDAEYFGPAEQGSVYEVVRSISPQTIVLIDGVFSRVPAVRHKEILYAVSCGIEVHGAASIGALRAAELAPFGMTGHGLIYRWARATPFIDDEEVAVAIAPKQLGAYALNPSLVDMRMTFRAAERMRLVPRSVRLQLEWTAQNIHFLERSYEEVFRRANAKLGDSCRETLETAASWVSENAINQKRADAIRCLSVVSSLRDRPRAPRHCRFQFEITEAFVRDLSVSGCDTSGLLVGPPPMSTTER